MSESESERRTRRVTSWFVCSTTPRQQGLTSPRLLLIQASPNTRPPGRFLEDSIGGAVRDTGWFLWDFCGKSLSVTIQDEAVALPARENSMILGTRFIIVLGQKFTHLLHDRRMPE